MPVRQDPSARSATATRRGFLAASGTVVAISGCRPLFVKDEPERPDPDVVATERALELSTALADQYADAVRRHPKLAKRLQPFKKRHEAHCAALRARLPRGNQKRHSPTATPTGSSSASPSPTPSTSPKKADDLRALTAAERDAVRKLTDSAVRVSPTLAEVLASISACSAAHVELLGR